MYIFGTLVHHISSPYITSPISIQVWPPQPASPPRSLFAFSVIALSLSVIPHVSHRYWRHKVLAPLAVIVRITSPHHQRSFTRSDGSCQAQAHHARLEGHRPVTALARTLALAPKMKAEKPYCGACAHAIRLHGRLLWCRVAVRAIVPPRGDSQTTAGPGEALLVTVRSSRSKPNAAPSPRLHLIR